MAQFPQVARVDLARWRWLCALYSIASRLIGKHMVSIWTLPTIYTQELLTQKPQRPPRPLDNPKGRLQWYLLGNSHHTSHAKARRASHHHHHQAGSTQPWWGPLLHNPQRDVTHHFSCSVCDDHILIIIVLKRRTGYSTYTSSRYMENNVIKLFHTPSSQMSYTSCPAVREKMCHVYAFFFRFVSTHTHSHAQHRNSSQGSLYTQGPVTFICKRRLRFWLAPMTICLLIFIQVAEARGYNTDALFLVPAVCPWRIWTNLHKTLLLFLMFHAGLSPLRG